ncbi:MAG: NAD(P)/FAD-dependent oxidoreductase, partial [Acidobacteriota bacterium]|nr:NAD(P)/FAD-dependent oxidoreductase [Acidobacteriota bacterium]
SVGLIPENELTREAGVAMDPITGGAVVDDTFMTNVPGIFSCGNVLHVHDLVDWVSMESEQAGRFAAAYVKDGARPATGAAGNVTIKPGDGIRYTLPQSVSAGQDFVLSMRVTAPWRDRKVVVKNGEKTISKKMARLHPAEMIRINVSKEVAAGGPAMEVSVE